MRAITVVLSVRWPEYETQLEQSYTALERDLLALDKAITKIVRVTQDRPVIFSHPVYQYLQKRYGINGKSVYWEPDVMPDDTALRDFADLIRDHPAKYMIWEGKPLPEIVTRLESMGFNPLFLLPALARHLRQIFYQ